MFELACEAHVASIIRPWPPNARSASTGARKNYRFAGVPGRPFVDWIEALRDAAELVFPVERASGAIPDPFDEMVLECAIAASAGFIVSGDKKHLLRLGAFRDIPILPPADFLRR